MTPGGRRGNPELRLRLPADLLEALRARAGTEALPAFVRRLLEAAAAEEDPVRRRPGRGARTPAPAQEPGPPPAHQAEPATLAALQAVVRAAQDYHPRSLPVNGGADAELRLRHALARLRDIEAGRWAR